MPDLETSLELCTFCPRLCSHTCPVSLVAGRETLTPQAKMASLALLRKAPGDEATAALAAPIYGCTGCGACTTACLHEVEPATALLHGRDTAEHRDVGDPALHDLIERHRRRTREAGEALASDGELAGRRAVAAGVALLPTCLPRRSGRDDTARADGPVSEAKATLRVIDRLRQAGADLPAVGVAALGQACGGYALYAGGYTEPFRLYAESLARAVEPFDTLLLSCSGCTWLLRTQYRAYGVPLRPTVRHVSEFLAPHAAALPITAPLGAASYHDACHLGRRLGIYDPPRQLLQRAVQQLDEFWHHHEDAQCCGSGGLLPVTDRALADAMAAERRRDRDQPVDAPIISGCPACQRHLGGDGAGDVRGLIEVLDAATTPAAD
jgi:Fe-S oxidoreductase